MTNPFFRLLRFYTRGSVIVLFTGIVFFVIFLLIRATKALSMENLSIAGEIFPAVTGTLTVTVLSVGLATPIGVLIGIYIYEYTGGKIREFFIFIFKVLGGMPSIVVGIFGFLVILFFFKIIPLGLRPGLIVSAFSLALLVLPYIVHATILALHAVPLKERLSALSLGAQKYQNIFYVLLPRSVKPVFSGIILAIGRAVEDTAVIMLTGVAAMAGHPSSLFRPFEALPFFIYIRSSEYRHPDELSYVYIASVIIIVICSVLIIISTYFQNKLLDKFKS